MVPKEAAAKERVGLKKKAGTDSEQVNENIRKEGLRRTANAKDEQQTKG